MTSLEILKSALKCEIIPSYTEKTIKKFKKRMVHLRPLHKTIASKTFDLYRVNQEYINNSYKQFLSIKNS